MTASSYDVAIVGGGPGGSATGLSLRAHAPPLSIVLIEATNYDDVRIGESLPPPARSILMHLGVWNAFRKQSHREVHGTTAMWGTAAPVDNDFIFMTNNTGWHIDRAAFDAMLAREAERKGTVLILETRVREVERNGNEWQLTLTNGKTLSARFIVDASGGSAAVARQVSARFVANDNLVGIAGFFECENGDPRSIVETFENGWWYTAALPDGRRIVACMTDADIARSMRLHDEKEWLRKLAQMPNIGARVTLGSFRGPVVTRSVASRRLEPVAGEDWLAAGDSASRFDPLSSQGIVKAMRSGIFASYAIADLLKRNDVSGLERYRRYVTQEFNSYVEVRAKYYLEEQRWPTSEFWRRRHGDLNMPLMNSRTVGQLTEETKM